MIYKFFTYCLFVFLFLSPHYLSINKITQPVFIIWNVGQGSWSSLVTNKACFHFDMGGEGYNKNNAIIQKCKTKQNILLLTHSDKDHIKFTYLFKKNRIKFCLYKKPREKIKKYNKKYLRNLQLCTKQKLLLLKDNGIVEIPFAISKKITFFKKKSTPLSTNFLSRVFLIKNLILVGGDSTKKAELLWKNNLPYPEKIKYFVLDHHGSKNSNHIKLFQKLSHLIMAIASAKKSRYKHPHKEVVNLLKKQKVALLQTEIWGSIYIYLKK
ncbi:MAG: hypothetical protein HAW63_05115 [Bdellovibrionaceae bacterium]|nr:hypothetical protein [Pseudobdellovibrionaceae bacterium]